MADQALASQTRIFDANGDPAPGALVNVYASGTLSRIDVWLDEGATTLATNPVVADANGAIPQIFLSVDAQIIVTTALGATLYTLDPVALTPTTGAAAGQVSFSPTANVPFSNVQDAVVGVDASLRTLILAGGAGVTGDAPLLSALDTTTTAGGAYRFSAATTGTFPSGVVAADTGAVLITRQGAALAVMEMYALGRAFRRALDTTWGAWDEIVTATAFAASQAEAEAGTDNAKLMTPLRVRNAFNATGSAPVYACRAWVNFDGTGTVAIRASGNVSSITDLGTGTYRVNYTTAMADANYAAVANAVTAVTGQVIQYQAGVNSLTATSCTIFTSVNGSQSNVTGDCALVCLSIFR